MCAVARIANKWFEQFLFFQVINERRRDSNIPLQSTYILHSLFLTIASRHYSLIVGVRACSTHFGYIDVMDNGKSQPFVHIVCCFEAAARRDNYRRQLCMKQNWQENEKFRWLTNGSGDTDKEREGNIDDIVCLRTFFHFIYVGLSFTHKKIANDSLEMISCCEMLCHSDILKLKHHTVIADHHRKMSMYH